MSKYMLGRKVGMTQLFDEDGLAIPVTVIDCGPIVVVQNKNDEQDGYTAVKVAYEKCKKVKKPHKGQFDKLELDSHRVLREFKTAESYELGQVVTVSEMFSVGDHVDLVGTSKGKGFQGSIKRHGYSRGPMSHGSKYHRGIGSKGPSATPGRVRKGKKMPGQMGNERVTVQNLEVIVADGERNILAVRGAVPGPKKGLVEISTSTKAK